MTVEAASPQIHYDSASVTGLITQDQVQGLPLNGRSFWSSPSSNPACKLQQLPIAIGSVVPVLGAPAANVGGARFTVDGGSVTSVGLGGAQMGFSQELVQEFQVSTVNFDLSAGMTDAGAINVVTRAGGNQHHANIFYFFRDHNLAAYPALNRDQSNPDPFFQRQQFGFSLGGPIRRNRIFYFANWERTDQRAVGTTTLLTPEFAHLSRISRARWKARCSADGSTRESMAHTQSSSVTPRMRAAPLGRQRRSAADRQTLTPRTGTAS